MHFAVEAKKSLKLICRWPHPKFGSISIHEMVIERSLPSNADAIGSDPSSDESMESFLAMDFISKGVGKESRILLVAAIDLSFCNDLRVELHESSRLRWA